MGGNTIGNANSANYNDGDYVGYPGMALTDVGAYGANSDSFFGTNDQGGNVWEWIDTSFAKREVRGGSWNSNVPYNLSQNCRYDLAYGNQVAPSLQSSEIGFRVASVPEPSCVVLTLLASGMLAARRKRC